MIIISKDLLIGVVKELRRVYGNYVMREEIVVDVIIGFYIVVIFFVVVCC